METNLNTNVKSNFLSLSLPLDINQYFINTDSNSLMDYWKFSTKMPYSIKTIQIS